MLKTRMESLFDETDKMLWGMIKAQGINICESIGDMNEEERVMTISACKLYTESKGLSLEMADMMDTQNIKMEQLINMNAKLIKQVENLQNGQKMLIEKIEEIQK